VARQRGLIVLVVIGMQAMIARIMAALVALRAVGILQSRPTAHIGPLTSDD
jgi:hypothetical protein